MFADPKIQRAPRVGSHRCITYFIMLPSMTYLGITFRFLEWPWYWMHWIAQHEEKSIGTKHYTCLSYISSWLLAADLPNCTKRKLTHYRPLRLSTFMAAKYIHTWYSFLEYIQGWMYKNSHCWFFSHETALWSIHHPTSSETLWVVGKTGRLLCLRRDLTYYLNPLLSSDKEAMYDASDHIIYKYMQHVVSRRNKGLPQGWSHLSTTYFKTGWWWQWRVCLVE